MSVGMENSLGLAHGEPASGDAQDLTHTRQLVLSAVLRGLARDDPWRHAYLARRWTGADDGKSHCADAARRDPHD